MELDKYSILHEVMSEYRETFSTFSVDEEYLSKEDIEYFNQCLTSSILSQVRHSYDCLHHIGTGVNIREPKKYQLAPPRSAAQIKDAFYGGKGK